jgi:polar amino acid transport system substrate-binding protein
VRLAGRALFVLALAASAAGAQARPVLKWGGDAEGGAPFVEADPADPSKVRGFDVEVAELIARGLGRTPQFVQVAWAQVAASVDRGDFTIGLSGLEDRPDMRARYAVSIPYYEFHEVLSVRPGDAGKYRSLADLKGRRVGTLGQTLAYQMLMDASANGGPVPVSYDNDANPFSDLVSGRLDAVLLDDIISQRSLRRLGGFVIQPEPAATSAYVVVLARRDSVLRDSVNAILRSGMRDGSLEKTYRAWNVWTDAQRAHFARQLAGDAARASTPVTGGPATIGAYLPALLRAAGVTLAISVLAMALAVVLGVVIAAGRVYGGSVTSTVLLWYVEIMRGTPVLLQLFVIYYGLAGVVRLPAFVAAVVGLGLNYAAYEAEIYRGALKAVPRPQLEAARTLGFSEMQTLRLIRGPLAFRFALAPMTNDFVALLKDSSLVSVITVVELTKQTAIYATNIGSWVVPGALCALVYLMMSLPLSRAARRIEQRWHAP